MSVCLKMMAGFYLHRFIPGSLVKDDKDTYTYDAFNRNTRVETFDGNVQINRYDAEGLRHEMEENGKLVQFIFRGTEVVAEETQEEKIRYIRAGELLASDAESARTYYHYASDEMGSITHVMAGADVLNRYEYDAWGNAEVCEEQVANRFRFNGQQYDPVSQQYYLRARFYNPVIARFTQEDTYRGDGLNLYAYCRNNPVYYVDPSGHFCDPAAQKIMEKLGNHQATRNEQKKLAAYLRNKDRHGGLTGAERGALQQVDSYTYLPRYENQTLPCKNNKEDSDSKKNKIPDNDSTTGHIFRDAKGHIPDTPENRELLEGVANDLTNFRGTDKYGSEWYIKTQSDGSQVWVQSRNGNIFEGGVNNTPRPWNSETGLKKP